MQLVFEKKDNSTIQYMSSTFSRIFYRDPDTKIIYKLRKNENGVDILFSKNEGLTFDLLNKIVISDIILKSDPTYPYFKIDFVTDSDTFYLVFKNPHVQDIEIYKTSKIQRFAPVFSLKSNIQFNKNENIKIININNKIYLIQNPVDITSYSVQFGEFGQKFIVYLVNSNNLSLIKKVEVDATINNQIQRVQHNKVILNNTEYIYIFSNATKKIFEYNTVTEALLEKATITLNGSIVDSIISSEGFVFIFSLENNKFYLSKYDLNGMLLNSVEIADNLIGTPDYSKTTIIDEYKIQAISYQSRLLFIGPYVGEDVQYWYDIDTLIPKGSLRNHGFVNFVYDYYDFSIKADQPITCPANYNNGGNGLFSFNVNNNILYTREVLDLNDIDGNYWYTSNPSVDSVYLESQDKLLYSYSLDIIKRNLYSISKKEFINAENKKITFSLSDEITNNTIYGDTFETDDFDRTIGVLTTQNNVCKLVFAERDGVPISKTQFSDCDPTFVTVTSFSGSNIVKVYYIDFISKNLKVSDYTKDGLFISSQTLIDESISYFDLNVDYNLQTICLLYKTVTNDLKIKKIGFDFTSIGDVTVDTLVDSSMRKFELGVDSKLYVAYNKGSNSIFKVYASNLGLPLFNISTGIFSELTLSVSPNKDFFVGGYDTSTLSFKGTIYSDTFAVLKTFEEASVTNIGNFSFNPVSGYAILTYTDPIKIDKFGSDLYNYVMKIYNENYELVKKQAYSLLQIKNSSSLKSIILYNNDNFYVIFTHAEVYMILSYNKFGKILKTYSVLNNTTFKNVFERVQNVITRFRLSKQVNRKNLQDPTIFITDILAGKSSTVANFRSLSTINKDVSVTYKKYAIAEEDAPEGNQVKLKLLWYLMLRDQTPKH